MLGQLGGKLDSIYVKGFKFQVNILVSLADSSLNHFHHLERSEAFESHCTIKGQGSRGLELRVDRKLQDLIGLLASLVYV
jgi:hypothetical protein